MLIGKLGADALIFSYTSLRSSARGFLAHCRSRMLGTEVWSAVASAIYSGIRRNRTCTLPLETQSTWLCRPARVLRTAYTTRLFRRFDFLFSRARTHFHQFYCQGKPVNSAPGHLSSSQPPLEYSVYYGDSSLIKILGAEGREKTRNSEIRLLTGIDIRKLDSRREKFNRSKLHNGVKTKNAMISGMINIMTERLRVPEQPSETSLLIRSATGLMVETVKMNIWISPVSDPK